MRDLVALIRRHAFQAANSNRFAVDAFPPAGRLTRSVASTAENPGEYIRFPVEHVGVGVFALRDQPNIFGNIGMRRARPLAIDNFVVVVWIPNIGRFHDARHSIPV